MESTTSFLRNKYWVLGHGESIPNERGLIVSSMENGTCPEYQLASEGVKQARLAGQLFQKVIEDLRERFFGPSFELKSHDKYPEIWALDEKDPFMGAEEGGGSVDDVVSRLTRAMALWKQSFRGKLVLSSWHEVKKCTTLVVRHGDPLQILQTILSAVKQKTGPTWHDLEPRIQAVRVYPLLSQNRKFALLTEELRGQGRYLKLRWLA